MAFLDSFKNNQAVWIPLLASGIVVITTNNVLQFLDFMTKFKGLTLLTAIYFILLVGYILLNKEEVLK